MIRQFDLLTVAGLVLGLAAVIGGMILEGGGIRDLTQITAAVIVFGGTAGATWISTPAPVMRRALRRLSWLFFSQVYNHTTLVEEIAGYAAQARRLGLVSLEHSLSEVSDDFLRKALGLAVDGVELTEIRKTMEIELEVQEQQAEEEAAVYEHAGGYSPTIGIIGAVLGLIQVMKNLQRLEMVGAGIAVAFVSTIYGVGIANLVLLPAASKIRARSRELLLGRQLMLEGALLIVEGLNPKLIRARLEAYNTSVEGGSAPERRVERLANREAEAA